jgi:hypothetical protein
VKNADLWRRLDAALDPHDVQWHWIKGHAGHPDNERADRLAVRGMQEATATENAPPTRSAATESPTSVVVTPHTDLADGDCVHQMPVSWCALCKPRPGVLSHGYRTGGGTAYHNDPDCKWLLKGQQRARGRGKDVHEKIRVAWGSVNPGELEPCEFCCTPQWLKQHGY